MVNELVSRRDGWRQADDFHFSNLPSGAVVGCSADVLDTVFPVVELLLLSCEGQTKQLLKITGSNP